GDHGHTVHLPHTDAAPDATRNSAKTSANTPPTPTHHAGSANNPSTTASNGPKTTHSNSTTSTPSARILSTQKTQRTSERLIDYVICNAPTECQPAHKVTQHENG